MTPKTITVRCPQCQHVYIDWAIPAVGTVTTAEQRPSTVCSKCGNRSVIEELVDQNGILTKISD